ncbi:hypothetical protein Actkin_03967 [Actinokineospora sp. UTMC 2448]|nr:hypothetical protein Actkin_03967 [Actinokineospora sp. UTMC 2448]
MPSIVPDPRGEVCWGTSAVYRGRAHLVPTHRTAGLCGMPVDARCVQRPAERVVCPECAIAYVAAVFPMPAPDLRHEVRLRA